MNERSGKFGAWYERSRGTTGGGLSGYSYPHDMPTREHGRPGAYWGYPEGGEHPESREYGPGYFETGERYQHRPDNGGNWDAPKGALKTSFKGKGPKGYKRSDARIY